MKYFLFAGFKFHPYGGWDDYVCRGSSPEEALKILIDSKRKYEWYQIVDIETREIVKSSRRPITFPLN